MFQILIQNVRTLSMTSVVFESSRGLAAAQIIFSFDSGDWLCMQLCSAQKAAQRAEDCLIKAQHGHGLWCRRDDDTKFSQTKTSPSRKKRGRLSLECPSVATSKILHPSKRTNKSSRYSTGTSSLGARFAFQSEDNHQKLASTKSMWEMAVPELCVKLKQERANIQTVTAPIVSNFTIPEQKSKGEDIVISQVISCELAGWLVCRLYYVAAFSRRWR